jgi:lipoprotein-anchoring transpeptidase ErfK/SrfK
MRSHHAWRAALPRETMSVACNFADLSGNYNAKKDGRGALMNQMWRPILAFAAAVFASLVLLTPSLAEARQMVHLSGYSAGTIVVKTRQRRLYYMMTDNTAIEYPVGVGRLGMAWSGTAYIDGKYIQPAWSPPDMIKRENPRVPNVIPSGSSANPMGAAAMTLSGGGQYAIHGTNNPGSIGGFVSHGCIRMHNNDILNLYGRAGFGTKVVVLPY